MRNFRNFYIIAIALALAIGIFRADSTPKPKAEEEIAYSDLLSKARAKEISEIVIRGEYVEGKLKDGKPFSARIIPTNRMFELLEESGAKTEVKLADGGMTFGRVIDLLGTLLWIAVLVMIFKSVRGGGAGGGGFQFFKNQARILEPNYGRVTFKDVLGIDEAKKEVEEVVDFLSDPEKYSRIGARIPKGVLLVGPPGTGKTLLARAIAGEAGVPFLSMSGSDFVEMFVGVGASRVRSLFESAKKRAPCLIFIDEIDAVGRHRGSGYGGGNDEREQTLNQLLVEMDGFETNEGIILVAATNRADVLDEALLRPGRFDRQVYISLPDIKGREAILKKYISEIKIASSVDAGAVARGTPGFSGAELANLVNEAALAAARFSRKTVTQEDFEYARDKILMGMERSSLTQTKEEIKMTAYHEAGHAICSALLPEVDPIHKVTIVPRGAALGMVQNLPERDKVSRNITAIRSDIAVSMAGRAAEEIFFGVGKITTGAESDIYNATNLARNSITRWGLSDKLGHVFYGEMSPSFEGIESRANISDETARLIDAEVKAMVETGYKLAHDTIIKNKASLEKLASALLEYETLTGEEVKAIIGGKKVAIKKDSAKKKKAIERTSTFEPTLAGI
ncbi:MAG: ATP-dependent zinc metalloprotease FtsH [Rickettsiales bacterium]|jgi:cell division protease FtsH|nr:ATP-dependent zinc metalloprotease FtsH [Rickettsiales bacterium]